MTDNKHADEDAPGKTLEPAQEGEESSSQESTVDSTVDSPEPGDAPVDDAIGQGQEPGGDDVPTEPDSNAGQEETTAAPSDDTAADTVAAVEPSPPPRATVPAPPPAAEPVASAAAQPAPESSRAAATPIAWLALVLVLMVAAGGFYMMMDMQRREGLLLQRVQGLESVSGQDETTFDQMRDNLQRQIELEIEGMAARTQRLVEDQERAVTRLEGLATESAAQTRRELSAQVRELGGQLDQLRGSLREQQARITDLSVEDRQSWLLAEAQYLLRLANQRLIMTGDTVSAEALLRSADNILQELDDADLYDLRSALASDLAAVRAVPKLDVQGLYLRLDALIRQTDALVLFQLPVRAEPEALPEADGWQERLSQGYELALSKLSEYVVVSRRDVPIETLMDPQYEGLVRQNMRMLLEQAQVAMLSGNTLLFQQSLERAEGWVTQFFKADEQSAIAMSEELRLIRDEQVSVTLPNLNASLTALDQVMEARLARGGS